MLQIIKKRNIYFTISGFLVAISLIGLIVFGSKLGIDFNGGTLMEVRFTEKRPEMSEIKEALIPLDLEDVVQASGENSFIIRTKELNEDEHLAVLNLLRGSFAPILPQKDGIAPVSALSVISLDDMGENITVNTDELVLEAEDENGEITTQKVNEEGNLVDIVQGELVSVDYEKNQLIEDRYEFVGPVIGKELRTKSVYAIILVLIAIILYVAWAFRKVSYPVDSWKYGIVAVIALFHDILIVVGVFVFLGEYLNVEVNSAFVAALLTILGYSVNDSIVVFDRIRENLPRVKESFDDIVNISVNETIKRSVNTSITTLLVLLSIYFLGGTSIKSFVLALIIGVLAGTYSSIFLASPLLVVWHKVSRKK